MHGSIDWLLGFDKRPRRTLARSPRAVPWEKALPWAIIMISQNANADDRGRASVCAKAVDASTSHDPGTSVIAKTPNACVWSGAGKRRSGRPNGVRTMPLKPSMPRQNVRAVSAPHLRHKRRRLVRLWRRVVTQQKFFHRLLCATGRGAMNRLRSRATTRHAIAVRPAGRRFAGCVIANASGGSVALSEAGMHACGNTRPLAHGVAKSNATEPEQRHHRRRPRDPAHRLRRSAVDSFVRQAP
jgi:hypothetical protein